MGEQGLEAAVKAVKKEAVADHIAVPLKLVTK